MKKRDWWSTAMLGLMIIMVLGCVLFALRIMNDYESANGGRLFPESIDERVGKSPKDAEAEKAKASHAASVRTELGQFGDFFGGTLNPLFGFVSVFALLLTIIYQARELKLSTDELRNSAQALSAQNLAIDHQRFEQTFFAWLDTYRELLASAEIIRTSDTVVVEYRGRRALEYWWKNHMSSGMVGIKLGSLVGDSQWKGARAPGESYDAALARVAGDCWGGEITKAAFSRWAILYREAESHLDSLFRVLYRLLLWIDSQPTERITTAQKWLYVSIVRAQLSWIEMAFLYCNGLTERGAKFRRLVEKYALLDNLTFESDPVLFALKCRPQDAADEYAPKAFSSELARRDLNLPPSAEETLSLAMVPHQPQSDVGTRDATCV